MKRIIIALDYNNADDAVTFAKTVSPDACRLKVGKELFTAGGPSLVKQLVAMGFDIFLDLKFHDIPNTVAQAVKASADLGVWMVNVHASGGERMMRAAKEALAEYKEHAPLLIAVTVLTSMDEAELAATGVQQPLEQHVLHLAKLAQKAGLDGVVCSAHEAQTLRAELGSEFCLVTPGIRPEGAETQDQTRIMTPVQAVAAGSDYLVMGRPIRQSSDPVATLSAINQQLS
ncbi:orotidine-5'-phosphate decarboxylase [Aliidiomarina taiwanensis]|nr:orotidine-5'-phosphate decarboxylase [Aliidiomarina taiwanensis]